MSVNNRIKALEEQLASEIQARKRAEGLLENKTGELYETLLAEQNSKSLFRNAISSIKEGILLTDRQHNVILCNEQLKKIYIDWAYIFCQDVNIKELFEPYMKHPTFIKMLADKRDHCSFEINLFDGKIIAVNVRVNQEGVIASSHEDVTQLRAVTKEQQNLLMKLLNSQKMETIGKMSGTIAHDFNNIIAAIKGYASFLDEDIPDDPNLRNSVDKILNATDKATNLVKQILQYRHKQKPNYHSVCVNSLLNECINMSKAVVGNNIEIHFEDNQEQPFIDGYEPQLSQVIMNLLSNAKDAIVKAPGHISITCQLFETLDLNQPNYQIYQFMPKDCYSIIAGMPVFLQPCVKIAITDNGIGMPENVLKNTFELFFSTKQEHKGSGFGMYSVANIITEHAGGIKIYSKPQHGTICEIVIPVKKSYQVKPICQNTATKYDKKDQSVMLVDDDEDVGLMLHQVFIRNNIKASYFISANKALDAITSNPQKWRLIICDHMMPDMSGIDLLKAIRDHDIATPFILHTAHISNNDTKQVLPLADDIIKKPTSHEKIIRMVKSYL